jgi:hypothetical protein
MRNPHSWINSVGLSRLVFVAYPQYHYLGQDFKRVGLTTLTDILNVVAPPISKHEVIQVSLSHDMSGYDGLESLVYRALAKVKSMNKMFEAHTHTTRIRLWGK